MCSLRQFQLKHRNSKTKMNSVVKICILLTFLQTVSTEKYLFESALVSYKKIKEKKYVFRQFPKLKTIDQHVFADVVKIKIETERMELFEGAVKSLPHLRELRMRDCGIQTLEPGAFKNLPALESIHLQENDISIIKNGVFNYLQIRELWLQKNEITTIESNAFDNMPRLEWIRLNKNMLTKWDSRWFANTPKLTNIVFIRNQITELPANAFANIKTSHKIRGLELVDTRILLNQNNISYIHPHALHGIDALHELSLKNNRLRNIDWKVFAHMTELHKLNMSLNFLTKIDANAFENISEMLVLNLSRNKFKCIPYEIPKKVKKVIISGNVDIDCQCLYNLREKLQEDRIENTIVASGLECAFD